MKQRQPRQAHGSAAGRQPVMALAVLAASAFVAPVLAQSSPYYIGLSETLSHDSNIFRRDDRTFTVTDPNDPANTVVIAPESSGLIATTALIGGFNQTIGRQRVYFDGRLGYASYANQPQMDTPIYGLKAGWDWATAEHWSGVLALSANQRQGPYESRRFDSLTSAVTRIAGAKLTDNTERAEFIVRFGAPQTSRVWLEGGIVYDHLTRDSTFNPQQVGTAQWVGFEEEYTSTALSFGARTRIGGALTAGAGLRTEDRSRVQGDRYVDDLPPAGAAPRYTEESQRNDIDLLADWTASGASNVRARLSYGQTSYDVPSQSPDQRNWSAALAWAWQPTGKSSMTTRLLHDNEDRERGVASDTTYGGNYVTSLEWTGTYRATGKITVDASVLLAWRDFDDTYTSGAARLGQTGDDNDVTLRLGVNYQPLRSVSTGCSIGRFSRRTTGTLYAVESAGPVQTPYESVKTALTPSCFVQVMLQ